MVWNIIFKFHVVLFCFYQVNFTVFMWINYRYLNLLLQYSTSILGLIFKGYVGAEVMLIFSLSLQCNASASQGKESVLPHQQFTSNSTVFTLTLDGLKNHEKHTRYIFELVSFSVDEVSPTCITAKRSLDDEYTPAVFKTIVVNSTGFTGTSYSAWKPVAYIHKTRSLENQVPSYAYYGNKYQIIKTQSCSSLPSSSSKQFPSIVHHLKGITFTSYGMNISFGQKKDGWYEASHYLSW